MINKATLLEHKKHKISEKEIYDTYKVFFGTLVSEPRLKIINSLRKGKRNVSEIKKELGMDQSAVSHNLSRLKKCGFVDVEINKKFHYYKINEKTIKPLMGFIDKHMSNFCIHILREMKGGRNKNDR